MRDDFSNKTKELLAKRVAWRCSFPGCGIITIGPGHSSPDAVINLGEAAHINAASKNGPRYEEKMTPEQRKSIENAIWLCRHHARIIDTDFINYSSETILQWKIIAEQAIYKLLQEPERETKQTPTTLVALGQNIVFEGIWKAVKNGTWIFDVHSYLFGDENDIISFNDPQKQNNYKYVVVESQGDGRLLDGNLSWTINGSIMELSLKVQEKAPRTSLDDLSDIAIGDDFDLDFEDGDFKIVKGADCARQIIMLTLSTNMGEMWYSPTFGSLFSTYYWKFKDKPQLLNRLLKLEVTRLLAIPTQSPVDKLGKPALNLMDDDARPPLDFINRVTSACLVKTQALNNQLIVHLRLEWGNGTHWEDELPIFIKPEENPLS